MGLLMVFVNMFIIFFALFLFHSGAFVLSTDTTVTYNTYTVNILHCQNNDVRLQDS